MRSPFAAPWPRRLPTSCAGLTPPISSRRPYSISRCPKKPLRCSPSAGICWSGSTINLRCPSALLTSPIASAAQFATGKCSLLSELAGSIGIAGTEDPDLARGPQKDPGLRSTSDTGVVRDRSQMQQLQTTSTNRCIHCRPARRDHAQRPRDPIDRLGDQAALLHLLAGLLHV